MTEMTGGCLCGQVRYSANTEPAFVGVCHCRNCQKQTGTAFSVLVGILKKFDADHSYGTACYQAGGCAHIIEAVAQRIDARQFNAEFPQPFPRFVQHAIWRYCAQSGLDVCNGNRIDDRQSCANVYCQIHSNCDRIVLNDTQ